MPKRVRDPILVRRYNADHKARNPEWVRMRARLSAHGLTLDQYQARLEAQGERCKVCRVPLNLEGTGPDSVVVDHDHATLEVRGLLCASCNQTLGIAQESAPRLRACAAYLEKFSTTPEDK